MRLHSIRLTNFRQHASTALEFGTGITGIIGPNGTGKTTILEAIAWALYGNEAARGKRDTIRFLRADPKAPVRVELDFDLAGHRYRIVRGITSAELFLDGGARPIANSVTTVTDVMQRRLGMSRSEFFNTYFTGQKELSVMTALGPTERAQFLSRVLGYERLRTAQELVRERRRELNAEVAGLRHTLPDPAVVSQALSDAVAAAELAATVRAAAQAAFDEATGVVARLEPLWMSAQQAREDRQRLAADLRVAEHELASLERDVARAEHTIAEADAAVAEHAALAPQLETFDALRAERDRLDAQARDEGKRQALTTAVSVTREELARLVSRREALAIAAHDAVAASAALELARQDVVRLDAAVDGVRTGWARDRQEAETRRDALRTQFVDVRTQRERIVEAGEAGTCPTCRRPLGTHFREVLDLLHSQLETLRVDGGYFKARLEQLQDRPAELAALEQQRRDAAAAAALLERRVADARAADAELSELGRAIARHEQRLATTEREFAALAASYDGERHQFVRRELERLQPLSDRAARLALVQDRAAPARVELQAAQAALRDVSQRVETLRTQIAAHGTDDVAFEQLRRDHADATTRAAAAERSARDAEFRLTAATDAVVRARAAHEDSERAHQRLALVARERRLHEELDQTFTDLRTDLNFALRPELSRLASVFLAELTDDRYSELDLDDAYNLVIVEDGIPKPVISGGEEDLANLVLRLAISQMIAERAGQAFSLLILDEVFGSLDDIRRQNVVELLRSLADRFEQVILITHIDAVRDGCDQVVLARYDAASGASVVTPEEPAAPARAGRSTVSAA